MRTRARKPSAGVNVVLRRRRRGGCAASTGPLAEIFRTLPPESWCRSAASAAELASATRGASLRCFRPGEPFVGGPGTGGGPATLIWDVGFMAEGVLCQ